MASVTGICGGLVVLKSGNVDFKLVLIVFFCGVKRGLRTPTGRTDRQAGRFRGRKSVTFNDKCFASILENMLPTVAGSKCSENS